MDHLLIASLTSLGLLISLGQDQAMAQAPRPTVSPYLNLLRPNTAPGINYYGLVRPQNDVNNALGRLQQQTTAEQQTVSNLETASTLPATGHAVGFQNYQRYFMNLGGTGGAARAPGLAAP